MKIKTITTWADYNYGASLQAFALLTYLKKRGHDVEMIRYLPSYQTHMYNYMWVNPESKASQYVITRWVYRIAKFVQRMTTLNRKHIFDDFNFRILPLTSIQYNSYQELCKNPPEADLYIVGSDQVWNVLYDAGKDPSFYLEFVKYGKKASYAASFSFLDIDDFNKKRIAESLNKFCGVSVREFQGQEFLRSIGINSTWVLDPVFLLSLNEWNELAMKANKSVQDITDKYLLIYDFEGNKKLQKFAEKYARIYDLKIYAITDKYSISYADNNFRKAGPIEFVKLIANCEAFISNSFHGTAFSIMYHKPVFVFNRKRHKVNSRMESLLTLFDLKDCLIDTEEKEKEAFHKQFNWKKIDKIQSEQLKISTDYLKSLKV